MILTLPDHMINPKLNCGLCDTNQKRNKKTNVFPQTLAGEVESRLKSHERSGLTETMVNCLFTDLGTTRHIANSAHSKLGT